MKINEIAAIRPTLLTPRNLSFYPMRVGTGKDKFVPANTRVEYEIESTGDYNDDLVLRLILKSKVMGYKTYVWSAVYESREEMRADGFNV